MLYKAVTEHRNKSELMCNNTAKLNLISVFANVKHQQYNLTTNNTLEHTHLQDEL